MKKLLDRIKETLNLLKIKIIFCKKQRWKYTDVNTQLLEAGELTVFCNNVLDIASLILLLYCRFFRGI